MRTHLIALSLLVGIVRIASAQDHLTPDTSAFADPDRYLLKIRHIFAPAFERDITVRALVLPSFKKEYLVGVQVGDAGAQVFVLEASSSIWDTELLEMYKSGEIGPTTTLEGKEIPLEENKGYQSLKNRTPADYRLIKAVRRAQPIPMDVAEKIKALWEAMLLDLRHPKEPILGKDGTTYHFSAWIRGRGDLSGHIWSPEPESKTGQLTGLARAMADFVKGTGSQKALTARLEAATKSIAGATR